MITEDYISFEIAKLLKEKGFDETNCNTCYKNNGNFCNNRKSMSGVDSMICYPAPTLQMVTKWLRETYDIHVVTRKDFFNGTYTGMIYDVRRENVLTKDDYIALVGYETYEKACEAAIKYCLENLI